MRLSRAEQERHAAAMALVDLDRLLTQDEREQVLTDYREDAQHLNGRAGAYFTPAGLARDFALHVPDGARILDLCAGIGGLSYAIGFLDEQTAWGAASIVCVEQNPDYARIGQRVLPRATWVCADAFDTAAYAHLGPFDCVISNPPFGRIKTAGALPLARYRGGAFEFRLIELASRLAPLGVFIVPQTSAPFRYSGHPGMEWLTDGPARDFERDTGIHLEANVGVDCSAYRDEWHGTAPHIEIVRIDREECAA